MKKLLLLSLLTFGFCTIQLHAMEEREDGTQISSPTLANNPTTTSEEEQKKGSLIYTIVCNNGELEIDQTQLDNFASKSKTIFNLLHDSKDNKESELTIPLSELEYSVIKDILTIIPRHKSNTFCVEDFYFIKHLTKKPFNHLIDLLRATDYLNIQSQVIFKIFIEATADKIIQEIDLIYREEEIAPDKDYKYERKFIFCGLCWYEKNKEKLEQLSRETFGEIIIKMIEKQKQELANFSLSDFDITITRGIAIARNTNPAYWDCMRHLCEIGLLIDDLSLQEYLLKSSNGKEALTYLLRTL